MVKLVINSKNESINYNSDGKESGGSSNNTYNVVTENGENLGTVSVSNSYNFFGNISSGNQSSISELNQKIKQAFDNFNTSITE